MNSVRRVVCPVTVMFFGYRVLEDLGYSQKWSIPDPDTHIPLLGRRVGATVDDTGRVTIKIHAIVLSTAVDLQYPQIRLMPVNSIGAFGIRDLVRISVSLRPV